MSKNRNYYERFPSAKPPQPSVPAETFQKASIASAAKLVYVLREFLPYLKEYADHEPFAVPVRVESGWRKGYTGGWEFDSKSIRVRPHATRYGASYYRCLLTENGNVGIATSFAASTNSPIINKATHLDTLSIKGLYANQYPRGEITEASVAAKNLESILQAAGVDIGRRK